MNLANKSAYPFMHYVDDFTKPEVSDLLTFGGKSVHVGNYSLVHVNLHLTPG